MRGKTFRIPVGTEFKTEDGKTYEDVNITDILNTNIVFVESNDDLPPVPDSNMLQIIITFLLGGCLLCLFIKRL